VVVALLALAPFASMASDPIWEDISPDWTTPVAPTQFGWDPTNADRIFIGTFDQGLYYTEDGGETWSHVYWDFYYEGTGTTIVRDIAFNPADPSQGVAGTMSGTFSSFDWGHSWTRDPCNDTGDAPACTHVIIDLPDQTGVVASEYGIGAGGTFWIHYWGTATWVAGIGAGGTFWIHYWGTATWVAGNPHLQNVWGESCLGLSLDQSDPPILYVGHTMRGILWTDNLGVDVIPHGSGLPDHMARVVTADPEIPQRVLTAINAGIYLNTSLEEDWEPYGTGLPEDPYIFALIHDPADPDIMYAATGGYGVYTSTDRGAHWTAMTQEGLSFIHVSDLMIHPLDTDYLIAATTDNSPNNGGVFRIRIRETSGAADTTPHGQKAMLRQNRPNPFHPETTIRFNLPDAAHVRLAIYDPAGNLVATPLDEVRPAGSHSVDWNGLGDDGTRLASGVYLYRLETGGGSFMTRQMVLLR
jgi:hypothetical protein